MNSKHIPRNSLNIVSRLPLMLGNLQYVARGIGLLAAVFLLSFILRNDDQVRTDEKALIKSNPVEMAESYYTNGNWRLYEIAKLIEDTKQGDEYWFAPGTNQFPAKIVGQVKKTYQMRITKGPIYSDDHQRLRKRANDFASKFNTRMLELILMEQTQKTDSGSQH